MPPRKRPIPRSRLRRTRPLPLVARGFDENARSQIRVRSRGMCEARCSPGCLGVAGDGEPHHRKLRTHGDHRPVNGLDVCPPCHSWIHANVGRSLELGLLVRSWRDPANVPVTV